MWHRKPLCIDSVLKHCAANRKRLFQRCQTQVHIYTTLAFLALLGAPYIHEISSLRVNNILCILSRFCNTIFSLNRFVNNPCLLIYEVNYVSEFVSIICNCGWSRVRFCRCSSTDDKKGNPSSECGPPRVIPHGQDSEWITSVKTAIKIKPSCTQTNIHVETFL